MADNAWEICPVTLTATGEAACAALSAVQYDLYHTRYRDDPASNHALAIHVRAWRRLEGWGVALVLTPWMLARVWLRDTDPGLPLPVGWNAAEREEAEPVVLGPRLVFPVLNTTQTAHLNHHPELGHHLLQPLILNLAPYADAEAAFAAWREVIARRDRFAAIKQRECRWQKEVSRREFFAGLGGKENRQD